MSILAPALLPATRIRTTTLRQTGTNPTTFGLAAGGDPFDCPAATAYGR